MHFEKTRYFCGEDAAPFLVQLKEENGIWRWNIDKPSVDPEVLIVAKALNSGLAIEQTKLERKRAYIINSQISDFPIPIGK